MLSGERAGRDTAQLDGRSREAIHFSTLVMPLALVSAQTTSSLTAAPTNSNFRASNSTPGWPRTWPSMSDPLNLPIVRPSGLATL